jgi:D-amino-acid oxidase
MTAGRPDVLVVGAGVIGLTTAVQLAEHGVAVEVRSTAEPECTTSAAAGAMWNPWLVENGERVLDWSYYTLKRLTELAGDPFTGVRLVRGVEAARREFVSSAAQKLLADVRTCDRDELPAGFTSGRRFTVPLIDMPVYLGYLRDRLLDAGGRLRIKPVRSLVAVLDQAGVVVNCTGARAGDLAGDRELYPVRGQLVVIANPGITEFFAEDTGEDPDQLYILPHGDRVVLGGTADVGSWNMEPDPRIAHAIVARCAAIMPSLATAPVLGHRVGLRPGRSHIRFEEQPLPAGGRLIHSYGHGGSGVTLSWGCARDVLLQLEASVP